MIIKTNVTFEMSHLKFLHNYSSILMTNSPVWLIIPIISSKMRAYFITLQLSSISTTIYCLITNKLIEKHLNDFDGDYSLKT